MIKTEGTILFLGDGITDDGRYVAFLNTYLRLYCPGHQLEIRNYDVEKAYCPGLLSDTLEFLLTDYAMYRFAKALGREEDVAYFLERTRRYKENYNPKTGFMGPRDETGHFCR